MDFYGICDNGKRIEAAPTFLKIDGVIVDRPTAEQYAACGCFPYAQNAPEQRDGYSATLDHYEAVEGRIYAIYAYAPIPAPIRTFSVAKLIYFVTERGTYENLKAALGESMMMQAVALGEFAEDNEDFVEIRPAVEAAFGADVVAAALDYAEV